jgi:maleylacetate reductase
VSAQAPTRVFRFGAGAFEALEEVCAEVGIERALLVTSRRGAALAGAHAFAGVFDGVASHAPAATVEEATALARAVEADGLVGLGGGSAIDTCKAVVTALAREGADPLPRIVAVPTTYAGAEWTPFFGTLLGPGRKGGGSDERAAPVAAIYDPELTLDLPLEVTVGTSLNALAHCAEAYYHPARTPRAERHADTGATAIGHALPLVVAAPDAIYGRTRLLEGAYRAALAVAESGICLGHAMAQVLGGRYGLPQGAMNAVCLPAAVRFNAEAVPDAVARFGAALGTDDPATRLEELALLGGFEQLRDFGVPEAELDGVAAAIVQRPGAQANPRPASADDVAGLLRSVW